MIEKELRDGLRGAVADEPPLGFDPDEAVTRIGVRVRRRRATAAVAAAVVAVIGGAVAVQQSVGLSRGGTVEIANEPKPTTASPAPSTEKKIDFQWPVPGLRRPERLTQAEAEARGEALGRAALDKFLRQRVKGVRNVKAMRFDATAAGENDPGPNVLEGGVEFRDQVGGTAVFVSVYSARYDFPSPDKECAEDPARTTRTLVCRVDKLADGTALVFSEERTTAGQKDVLASATHYRLDGVVVRFTAYTYDPTGNGRPDQPRRERPALTEAQLTALATDRAFTM
ncbi:hypothetical protein [Allokutzneria albata]|uniref:Uncharacterized protein n=1 Tax=Allokutzneria albata TaxID=211114 RepID=A0A1G9ZGR8_ALLAB|nr:hypothetical protein [Allokutzneria albata]SDN20590.1 hypothetical protein SAMN04489726_5499 [Allokutzneria albata]